MAIQKLTLASKPSKTEDDLRYVAKLFLRELQKMPEGRQSRAQDIENHRTIYGRVAAGIRYWGHWVMPDDVPEEDQDDYDHKELHPRDRSVLEKKAADFSRLWNVKITISPSEKEYIDIFLE